MTMPHTPFIPAPLSDGIITLRPMEPEDVDAIVAWENDTRAWTDATAAAPFSRRVIEDYVMTYDPDIFAARQLRLIIDDGSGAPAGAIDLFEFDPVNRRAGIGIVVDPSRRRRGMALRAINILAAFAADRLSLHQLWAIVGESNGASRALFDAAGFKASGRLRSWLRVGSSYADALFLQRLLP